jgi:hypothetical protein
VATTAKGGVALGGPGLRRRLVVPNGWGASDMVFSPDGRMLGVARLHRREEAWTVDIATGRRTRVWSTRGPLAVNPPVVARFSPDGEDLLFWRLASASIDADGRPLLAAPTTAGAARKVAFSLIYPDYVAACRSRVVLAAGEFRYASSHKHLMVAQAPSWRGHRLTSGKRRSWVSPSCPASGRVVAAAAGPNRQGHFGRERRSIWVVPRAGGKPRRLTFAATKTITDDSPRISNDGRTILFVRMHTGSGDHHRGDLYALRAARMNWHGPVRAYGPIMSLGSTGFGYYGHYGWDEATDWYQPR